MLAMAQDHYEVIDLGAPTGALGSKPVRVNSVGTVIGQSYPGIGHQNAWIYLDEDLSDMGVLRDQDHSARVFGINAANTVLGQSYNDNDKRGFIWSPFTGMLPIVYTLPDPIPVQGITPPDKHPGSMTVFEGVDANDFGCFVYNGFARPQNPPTGDEITGNIAMFDNPNDFPLALPYNPLYIKPLQDGDDLFARVVNNNNMVAGIDIAATDGEYKVFRWQLPNPGTEEGQTQEINVKRQDDTYVEVTDINDLDFVIGHTGYYVGTQYGQEQYYQPAGWIFDIQNETFCDQLYYLPGLPGDGLTEAHGINNNGLLVGRSGNFTSDQFTGRYTWRGVMWVPVLCTAPPDPPLFTYEVVPVPLDNYLPPGSGWTIIDATSINDAGQITAVGVKDGQVHSILLNPIRYPIGLTFDPNPTGGGTPVTGTITIDQPAPPGGTTLTMASDRAEAQVPPTVTVPAGEVTVDFPITTSGVSVYTAVRISASNAGHSKMAQLTLLKTELRDIFCESIIEGGTVEPGKVRLTGVAPFGGATVNLTSSEPAILTVPSFVSIPAGQITADLPLTPPIVNEDHFITLTASWNGLTKTKKVLVCPVKGDAVPIGISVNPNQFAGTGTVDGLVTIQDPAPQGGARLHVSSNNAAATVPFSITIPEGELSAPFTVNCTPVNARTVVLIGADVSGRHVQTQLTLNPLNIQQITVVSPITGGKSTTGKVRLNGVTTANFPVAMSSSNPSLVGIPATVTVLAGQSERQFTITTQRVVANTAVTIRGTAKGITRAASLTVIVPFLDQLKIAPASVVGGSNATGTVILSGLSNAPGTVISLRSASVSVAQVPATVTVPTDLASRNFIITTRPVAFRTNVTIIATYNGNTRTKVLTVNP